MLSFPIDLTADDNGTLLVTCRHLPMVATFGEDEAAALLHAREAIETALASMIADGENIPLPQEGSDGATVPLPLLTELKVRLYLTLRAQGVTRAELARRLGWKRESVDRLFRLSHRSRLEQLDAAFDALGQRLELRLRKAA